MLTPDFEASALKMDLNIVKLMWQDHYPLQHADVVFKTGNATWTNLCERLVEGADFT